MRERSPGDLQAFGLKGRNTELPSSEAGKAV